MSREKTRTVRGSICRNRRTASLFDERGYMLLEIFTSLPVYLVLLLSLFAVWLLFLKSYVVLLGDWELQQEMRLTLERIAQDVSSATHIEVQDAHTFYIERWVKGEKCRVDYALRRGKMGEPPYISKKVTGGVYGYFVPQPMTGGRNVFGNLAVVDFSCTPKDGLLLLCLTGQNRRTKKCVTFSTAVCMPKEMPQRKEMPDGKAR